jgi:outer membrane protein OmpA-like peptidoglycan-associated protein
MKRIQGASFGVLLLAMLALAGTVALAQTVKSQGLIKSRSGATLTLQAPDAQDVTVLLTDSTKVEQSTGLLKARRKDMSMAALIPGLAIKVEGTYDDKKQLVASTITFSGDDLKNAKAVQAGMHETQAQAERNREMNEKQSAALQAQAEDLKKQQEQVSAQQQQLTEQQAKINANKAMIDAAVARFGQLDDYYILDEVTVLFANGKVSVDPKYKQPLLQLAQKAKTVEAFMIEVKGYASSVGSVSLNQKLSEDRANNVTHILIQEGGISLTHMLAPGAMGESEQVGNDKTAEGQAENRRVVVRVLQNKGISGGTGGQF